MFKHKKQEVKIEENLKTDNPPVLETVKVEGKPEDLRELIEKNIKWTQVVYEQNRKIKNRLTLMVLGGYIRLALVLIPLILGVIFLPPLFKQWFGQYSSLLQGLSGGAVTSGLNLDQSQLQGMLQDILKGR